MPISRDDLEAAFSKVLGEGEDQVKQAAPPAIAVTAAALLGVLAITYLLGKRKGSRRSAVLEITRV